MFNNLYDVSIFNITHCKVLLCGIKTSKSWSNTEIIILFNEPVWYWHRILCREILHSSLIWVYILLVFRFWRERDYYKQWSLCNRILYDLRWYCQLKIGSRCLSWITNGLRSGEKGWKGLNLSLDELKSRLWAYHEIWSHHQHVTPSIESQYFTVYNKNLIS